MATICPTVTAYEPHEYREQLERISGFTSRIHIDLMDGELAPIKSVGIERIWWPHHVRADLHIMFKQPMDYLNQIIRLNPRLVIIHAEAVVHHMHFASELHKEGIEAGLAVLQDTPMENVTDILHSFDHLLVFSGKLGYHGGKADLGLLSKVRQAKRLHPDITIGWDGGISDKNVYELVENGVDVLNVGGYIQKSRHPEAAYAKLRTIIDKNNETKTYPGRAGNHS